MKKKFSQMLEEMGFAAPQGRGRFFDRPMPTRSSQVDVDLGDDTPDTGISGGPDMGPKAGGLSDAEPFQLGDDQIVIMSTSALKKLLGAADGDQQLGFDELPDEDDLFGSQDDMAASGEEDPEMGGFGSEEDSGRPFGGKGFGRLDTSGEDELGSGEDDMGDDEFDIGSQDFGSEEDKDRQGNIRNVKGARLSYKRQQPDGTFSEMWVYNVGEGMQDTLSVKRAILSGTDIPDNHFQSQDGKQRYKIVTMGNAQILKIEGLPN